MRVKRWKAEVMQALLLVALLVPGWALAQTAVSDQEARQDAAGFKEFSDHVKEYVQLHKSAEATILPLKPTDRPEMITAYQQALARKIREARPRAKRGDIFTHKAREAFRHVIRSEFLGPQAAHARATIQQGAPLEKVHLQVNQTYPESAPHTTVPPTLLLQLPKLPNEVAYRIVDRDLVLLDVKANLAVDLIPKGIP